MRRFEGQVLRRFDHILAVSETDRETLVRLYPLARALPISVIPTGVDTEYFVPAGHAVAGPPNLVFTGSMDWLPNVDGVRFFCRDILPSIREVAPDTTFTIVGRSPTADVRRLGDEPGVEVTGRVDDIRPFLDRATVYVVPLRIGGGTRLKIFEAMSAGKAVVSTTIGAEGLPVENGRHVLLADTPETFAATVVDLVRDAAARHELERNARALVTERYDWSAAATHLERALLQTRTPASSASSTPLTSLTGVQHS
jgi:glycosyltransferase involved in cell wall biosynthesis